MKKQVFMLLALCVAGVASAASVQWGSNEAFGEGTNTLTSTTNLSGNISGLTITISGMKYTSWVATQANTRLFTVYGANGTAGANGITTGGTEGGSEGTPKSYFDVFVTDNGTLGWGVAGNRGLLGYKSGDTGWSIVDLFGENDTLTLTYNKTSSNPSGMTLKVGENEVVLGTGQNFGLASYEWNTITVTSLPEPGVLTLLALGVAGLALRRKVA